MSKPANTIHRMVAEIQVPSSGDGILAQNEASLFIKQSIIPIIERVTDKIDTGEYNIRIDKLELDFGVYSPGKSNDFQLREFEFLLEQEIIRCISKSNEHKSRSTTKSVSEKEELEELFLFLLEYGLSPWWYRGNPGSIKLETICDTVLASHQADFIQKLKQVLVNKTARQRVAFKLNPSQVKRIISLINTQPDIILLMLEAVETFLKTNAKAGEASLVTKIIHEHSLFYTHAPASIYEFLEEILGPENTAISPAMSLLLKKAQISFKTIPDKKLKVKKNKVPANSGEENASQYYKENELSEVLKNIPDNIIDEASTLQESEIINIVDNPDKLKDDTVKRESGLNSKSEKTKQLEAARENALEEKTARQSLIKKSGGGYKNAPDPINFENKELVTGNNLPPQAEDKDYSDSFELFKGFEDFSPDTHNNGNNYFIQNAGLIIVAPFLPALFEELSLTKNASFINHESQERAVCILNYLATGNEQRFEEHEMVFNKILCGFQVFSPLIYDFTLNEKEKEECKNLLGSVVQHWTALKNTSPESMRDAFFIRDGLLEKQSNGWNLKIEKTTLDILVDRLPWSISVVRLPWSEEILFVDWT